jgi:DNA-directed RNA polymerase subunit L
LVDRALWHVDRAIGDDFHFEHPADHHPLFHIRQPDPCDIEAALRLDDDEALEREPVDGASDREARHAETGAPFVLIDQRLPREDQAYNIVTTALRNNEKIDLVYGHNDPMLTAHIWRRKTRGATRTSSLSSASTRFQTRA